MNSKAEALQKIIDSRDPLKKNSDAFKYLFDKITSIKGDKGDQGEPGYSPLKGKDYYTEQEINFLIKFIQDRVKNGIDGINGTDGRNGETPIRGIDYWSPKDQEKILQSVLAKIPAPKDGVSPNMEDIVNQAVDQIQKKPIEFKDIKGTEQLIAFLKTGGFRGGGGSGGGSTITLQTNGTPNGSQTLLNLKQGTNVTIVDDGVGGITINSTGGSGTPGGLNTQVQYNNAGSFGGITGAVTNGTILSLTNPLLGGATLTTSSVNGVTLVSGGTSTLYLSQDGTYTAPAGTIYTGTTNRITVTGTVINIAATYVGQSSITTLGTITTGVWNGTAIANANLANSSLTIGSTNIALGATSTTLAGLTSVTSTAFVGALTGNASTATALAIPRTIGTITGDATSAGSSFDGTANNTNALTLATVNSNVGSFTNANITVDGKGRITAASNGTGGGGTPAGSTGDIQFNTAGSFAADTGNLFYDSTNHRLSIGTTTPLAPLYINQPTNGTGTISVTGASGTVTGTSTLFLSDFSVGDTITANTETHTITAIASNTSMTTDVWTGTFSGIYTTANTNRYNFTGKGTLVIGNPTISANTGLIVGQRTYTNNTSTQGIIANIISNQTTASFSGSFFGVNALAAVGSSNTQNWTGSNGIVGLVFNAQIQSGASGTITSMTGNLASITNSSGTATLTNGYGMKVLPATANGGAITNFMGYSAYNLGIATNNTGLYLSSSSAVPIAPTGNYGIYDATGYNNYFTSNVGIGTVTPLAPLYINQPLNGTGTISVTAASGTVTGTGTLFISDFTIGDTITANSETHTITAIASNTSMTTDVWTSTFSGVYTTTNLNRYNFTGKGALIFGNTTPGTSDGLLIASKVWTNPGSIRVMNFQSTVNQTSASYSGTYQGINIGANIGASNTQNWTNATGAQGIVNSSGAASGATGTITGLVGIQNIIFTQASGATITNGYGILNRLSITGGGVMTNYIAYVSNGIGTATNNTAMYFTTGGNPTAASGNWLFYDTTGYQSTIAGNFSIGSTTTTSQFNVGSAAQFQINSSGVIVSAAGITSSGTINFSTLSASSVVFTDASKNLTSTGIGTSSQFIKGDGSLDSSTYITAASLPVGANPSASVGLAAVNGSATTFMRSDGAPALSQAIVPTWTGVHTFTPGARSSGVASYFTINASADTGITTATESIGINHVGSTRTWVDGTVATQREYLFQKPTYNKTTTSATFTKAATVAISGAPTGGTGVTITNAYALWVQAGGAQFDGGLTSTTVNATTGFEISGAAASGKILVGNGTNFVASTPTFPNASATTRKIIVSDGTNWVASTETYAVPGTSGNVLTSNGTNWVSSAPSTGTPRGVISTAFETAGRFQVAGVGTATFGSGCTVDTSASTTSSIDLRMQIDPAGNIMFRSPTLSFTRVYWNNVGLAGTAFLGMGVGLTVSGSAITYTGKHVGFKATFSGSTGTLFATQADGTTENVSSSLTTFVAGDCFDFVIQVNGTASVDYYWSKNGGALSAATNLTTNLSVTTGQQVIQWAACTNTSSARNQMILYGASYSPT